MSYKLPLALGLCLAAPVISFAGPGPAVPAKPAAPLEVNADYELRGFFGSGDMVEVSVSKKGASSSDWIPVGHKRGALTVVSATPNDGTAVVMVSGKRSLLRLASAGAGTAPVADSVVTIEDLQDAHVYLSELQHNLTPEQLQAMAIALKARLASDKELAATFASFRPSKGKLTPAEMIQKMTIILPPIGEALGKALELPGKDGVIHPMPRSLERIVNSPGQLNQLFEKARAQDADAAK